MVLLQPLHSAMTQLIQVQKNEENVFFFPSFYDLMIILLESSTSLSRIILSFFKRCTLLSLIFLSMQFQLVIEFL